jgi:hypothetical protein
MGTDISREHPTPHVRAQMRSALLVGGEPAAHQALGALPLHLQVEP